MSAASFIDASKPRGLREPITAHNSISRRTEYPFTQDCGTVRAMPRLSELCVKSARCCSMTIATVCECGLVVALSGSPSSGERQAAAV